MNKTQYSLYINKNNEVIVTALVSPYGFRPEGNEKDWIAYVKENVLENQQGKKVKLYEEAQDKQTGYTHTYLVWEFM